MTNPHKNHLRLSFVLPCHNETGNIERLLAELINEFSDYEFEALFVDDGSTDETLAVLHQMAKTNPRVKYLSFSRNFGHQAALKCGLKYASGDCCIVMDSDLQHPVSVARAMFEKWLQGYKIVRSIRLDDKSQPFLKRAGSRLFYRLMAVLGLGSLKQGMADFYLLDRQIVDIFNEQFTESQPFIRGLLSWIGFDVAEVPYQASPRISGHTKYNLPKMIKFGVNGVTSFSTQPLVLAALLGLFFLFLCGIYVLAILYIHFIQHRTVPGWSSLIIVTMVSNGVTLTSLGVLGQYIGSSYLQLKSRPDYIVKESNLNE